MSLDYAEELCLRSLGLLDDYLIPMAENGNNYEAKAHYLKIKGDIYKTMGQVYARTGGDR